MIVYKLVQQQWRDRTFIRDEKMRLDRLSKEKSFSRFGTPTLDPEIWADNRKDILIERRLGARAKRGKNSGQRIEILY